MRIDIPSLSRAPALAEIGAFIARVRRASHATSRERDAAHATLTAMEREVGNLPATLSESARASCIASIEAQCEALRRRCHELHEIRLALGYALLNAAPLIDAHATLGERCELLNINAADRGDLTEADGVERLVFLHALEDSAERRRDEFNDGPLFNLARIVFSEFLRSDEGRAASDGMLARLPAPRRLH